MLRIECPWCGLRDEEEFEFGGPSHVVRPAAEANDAQWSGYLFGRDNPKGVHFERWFHRYGCERWFNVARDTVTHVILAVYGMGEVKPSVNEHGLAAGEAVSTSPMDSAQAKFR
jgi:heterotetrameric sarcosine oxidase delta subunit